MPKKKNVATGFGLLMKELQAKHSKNGRMMSMEQLKPLADPIWKTMTADERQVYNDRAKLERRRYTTDKLASDGTSIEGNEKLQQEGYDEIKKMYSNIRQLIDSYEQDPQIFRANNVNQKFYMVSFNILCCTSDKRYVPLEVSLAEYSISKGIIKVYHKFIYPGPPPVGYTGEAKRHSENTHHIEIFGHENSEKNYCHILREMCDFLCPGGESDPFPPLFTMPDMLEQVYGCFDWLCEKAGTVNHVHVWDVSYLLYELRSGAGSSLPSKLIARELLAKPVFDYVVDTRCYYHEELDSPHCTLGFVRRLCFLLSDSVCNVFDVEVTDKHLPVRAQKLIQYEVLSLNSRSSSSLSLPKSSASMRSSLAQLSHLDEFSDEESDNTSLSSYGAYSQTKVIADALGKMNLNTTAPGKGIGRGRPKPM